MFYYVLLYIFMYIICFLILLYISVFTLFDFKFVSYSSVPNNSSPAY